MSVNNGNQNPFLGLFSSPDNSNAPNDTNENPPCVKPPVVTEETPSSSKQKKTEDPAAVALNLLAEDVFGFTAWKNNHSIATGRVPMLVHLADIEQKRYLDLEILKVAIFERVILNDPGQHVLKSPKGGTPNSHVVQTESLIYLFDCYERLRHAGKSHPNVPESSVLQILTYVLESAATVMRQPALFDNQDPHRQVVELYCLEEFQNDGLTTFMSEVAQIILTEDDRTVLKEAFQPVLMNVHRDFARSTVLTFPRSHFGLLSSFVSIPLLAELLVETTMPYQPRMGFSYAETLLGAILNLSCLPKVVDGPVEYFEKPLDAALSALEGNLWSATSDLCDKVHSLVEQILRGSPELRRKILTWLGGCLDSNLGRGKTYMSHFSLPGSNGCVSDGFAHNLASVLLRLSVPFIKDKRKLLKIDPTYPAFNAEYDEDWEAKGVHCKSLFKETCLQPAEDGVARPLSSQTFSFITECFHLTHRALDIGVRVLLEKTQKTYQEIGRLQQTMSDLQRQVGRSSELLESCRETMESEMSRFLCMRCALLEPNMLKLVGQFEVATSTWLIQVILDPVQPSPRASYAPTSFRDLHFPLPEAGPPTLQCVPELVVESVWTYLKLAKVYSPRSLEEGGLQLLEPLLSMLLVLMGSKERARNPHLRAYLAQCLDCLLPRDQEQPSLNPNPLGVFYREKLFLEHPHKEQVVVCLLHVFVSIEMTGESVAFEEKFNYRRPMYTVMDYLWGIPEHREVFRQLANEAEQNMEKESPPLFLRFINLLMNDAIFLLDEALSNMATLRTMQAARDNGEWQQLPSEERSRNDMIFNQIGSTARFDNILGKDTIHTLEYMSTDIMSVLCHSTMVDRIASMLNYFLLHLVGPKKKNFKVKDHADYKFDPGTIVTDICKIYVNLKENEAFCAAVSRDGRSYNHQLFTLAVDVLAKIGGGSLVTELLSASEKFARYASIQQTDEELLSEAPEEFLDPIMSTLMTDPVTLPSSKINIDRSTIARHLLSDQTDPFNRSPLTMNMVQSNTDLKERINTWIAERRAQPSQSR